jgi:hypothetical protein
MEKCEEKLNGFILGKTCLHRELQEKWAEEIKL